MAACNILKCVPEITEANESGTFVMKHTCPINKRNCWVSEHEIYNVWDDIYKLFMDGKIINLFQNIVEKVFKQQEITVEIERRRTNFAECNDIIVKVYDSNNKKKRKEIGHFSLHSKLPKYYRITPNKKIYTGCGYYEKNKGERNVGSFHYKGKNENDNYIIKILFDHNFEIKKRKIIRRQEIHFQMYNLFAIFWNNHIVPEIANYSYKKLTPINDLTKIADSIIPVNLKQRNTPPQWGRFAPTKTRKTKTRKTKTKKPRKTVRKTKTRKTYF